MRRSRAHLPSMAPARRAEGRSCLLWSCWTCCGIPTPGTGLQPVMQPNVSFGLCNAHNCKFFAAETVQTAEEVCARCNTFQCCFDETLSEGGKELYIHDTFTKRATELFPVSPQSGSLQVALHPSPLIATGSNFKKRRRGQSHVRRDHGPRRARVREKHRARGDVHGMARTSLCSTPPSYRNRPFFKSPMTTLAQRVAV